MPLSFVVVYEQTSQWQTTSTRICLNPSDALTLVKSDPLVVLERGRLTGALQRVSPLFKRNGRQTLSMALTVGGVCVSVCGKERGGWICRQDDNTHKREQANIASLKCFPKHNLTACPLQLHIPLHGKTKQTGGGVLLTDGKSPRIRSISSLAPTKKTIYPDCTPRTSKHTVRWRRRLGLQELAQGANVIWRGAERG